MLPRGTAVAGFSTRSRALPNWRQSRRGTRSLWHCPVCGSQVSAVHRSSSVQSIGLWPTHWASLQMSTVVHASLSSHGSVLASCLHTSLTSSHESSVQTLPSLQLRGCPTHTPPVQVSETVQNKPSSHGLVFGVASHRPAPLHRPSMQGLPPAKHGAPTDASVSAGHGCSATPLHFSTTSQSPFSGLQTVPALAIVSAGQAWSGT